MEASQRQFRSVLELARLPRASRSVADNCSHSLQHRFTRATSADVSLILSLRSMTLGRPDLLLADKYRYRRSTVAKLFSSRGTLPAFFASFSLTRLTFFSSLHSHPPRPHSSAVHFPHLALRIPRQHAHLGRREEEIHTARRHVRRCVSLLAVLYATEPS